MLGCRYGRSSSARSMKDCRSIRKFFFHSASGKTPLNRFCHHWSVRPGNRHGLPRRHTTLLRTWRSLAKAALYSKAAFNVNCLWWLRSISRVQNNSPKHWKAAANGTSDKKIKLAAKTFLLSAILFVVLSDRSKDSPLTTPLRRVACKGGLCFIPSSRVTRLAGAPSLHVNRPLLSTNVLPSCFTCKCVNS